MSTALLAREMLETLSSIDKKKVISKRKFLLKGEDLFLVVLDELGGMCTPSKLAEYTDFSPARLSAIIKSLENKGFVIRRQDELDKRFSIIEITSEGIRYTRSLKESAIRNSLEIIEKLGEKDAAEFVRLMKKMLEIMIDEERSDD